MIATRSPQDGAPEAASRPPAARPPVPAEIPPSPVAPAPRPVVSTHARPFNRREQAVLTAGTVVGSFILRVAETVAPLPHQRRHR